MRRVSVPLAIAALIVTAIVLYTYRVSVAKANRTKPVPAPQIKTGLDAAAHSGWSYTKDDPVTNKPVVQVTAESFEGAHDPSSFRLGGVKLRLYHKQGDKYTYVHSLQAFFDERTGVLKSDDQVTIVMNVPADKNAENPAEVARLVQVQTSGVTYQTKDGKADCDKPATFRFTQGGGQATGVSYDPSTGELNLKSAVALDLASKTPGALGMHVEAGTLVYKEHEQKIYLSPWSKLQRGGTRIEAATSIVTLQDGVLQRVDSDRANGEDKREDKLTQYSADQMTALFDDNGVMTKLLANGNAHVISTSATSRTTLTSARAELNFTVHPAGADPNGPSESDLDQVAAEGQAIAQSDPLPPAGQKTPDADSHTLRSERILLHMKPGGKDVQEIEAPQAAQLDFLPHRPDHPSRSLNASHLRIFYGEGSYIDRFLAWDVRTHTQKPSPNQAKPVPPSTTWSDSLAATFKPNSNQIANLEQTGHFRYQEGTRRASAGKATLDDSANLITLVDNARMADDTGSTSASKIVLNQATGDMDALGHVSSSRAPDKNQKPGTSVLDSSKLFEGRADSMQSRESNTLIFYNGHATVWQGANRIAADTIQIDRDSQTLSAKGNVTSELVDNQPQNSPTVPLFTTILAPELLYKDEIRRADYTGGVKLLRAGMTVSSDQLQAFLNAQSQSGDSSLDHAVAQGDVKVVETPKPGDTRTGTGQTCEYFTKENKVILSGGSPQIDDTVRGVTRGRKITYFSDDDRLIVEGENKHLSYSHMRKR
jgi:lipopolysaccharide export system protein LptA